MLFIVAWKWKLLCLGQTATVNWWCVLANNRKSVVCLAKQQPKVGGVFCHNYNRKLMVWAKLQQKISVAFWASYNRKFLMCFGQNSTAWIVYLANNRKIGWLFWPHSNKKSVACFGQTTTESWWYGPNCSETSVVRLGQNTTETQWCVLAKLQQKAGVVFGPNYKHKTCGVFLPDLK